MKLRILKEEGESSSVSSMGAVSNIGSSVPDNISVGSNAINYGGRNNPYLSNLAEYEHKKKKKNERKYDNEYKGKKDRKNAGHKANKKKNRFYESWYE